MPLHKLAKRDWRPYLDEVSKALDGCHAHVEVTALNVVDHLTADWAPLLGCTYDPKDDLIEIILGDLDHLIRAPRDLWLDERSEGLVSLEIVDGQGVHRIVRLRDPLILI